jgi:peptidoglycan/xylan/chitin deacetylase (PgdA/CDA1 family)
MPGGLRSAWEKNWPEAFACITGAMPRFVLARTPRGLGDHVPVFCYHVVRPREFEEDLDHLARNGYVTIDAERLADHMAGSRLAPERAVVLTIDDGARNLREVAFPILARRGMRAVAFVVPRFHDAPEGSCAPDDPLRPLTWSELREMSDSGVIDVQSHSYEHRYLPRWPEPVPLAGWPADHLRWLPGEPLAIAADLALAKRTLEERLDKPVRHLAFPKYQGTREAVRLGTECGYRAFWWGALPAHRGNRPGRSPTRIFRLNGEWLRRLPGDGRRPLGAILRERAGASASRLARRGV